MENSVKNIRLPASGKENAEYLFGEFDFGTIVDDICGGKFSLGTENIINRIIGLFFGELKTSLSLMSALITLILLCAVINNLQESFGRKSLAAAGRYACFAYLTALGTTAFSTVCGYVSDTLRDLTILINSIVPSLTILMTSGGNAVLGAVSHPVIFFVCTAMAALIKNVITPLVLLRAVTTLICGITGNRGMNEFSNLFTTVHRNLLAFSMSVFSGILGVSRFAAGSFDNLAARGIKFAVSASVPIVGGSISEAMSSVASSASLLKNAVGIAGVIGLFSIFVIPLVKISALAFVYRLSAALAAPVADENIVNTLRKMGECIDMLFSSVACCGVMMIISVASVLSG